MKLKLLLILLLFTTHLFSQNLHLGSNGRVGIGNTNPQNKIEITSDSLNASGLRLSNLTSTSTTQKNNGKVLSVNQLGDIISTELFLGNTITWSDRETNNELINLGYKFVGSTNLIFNGLDTNSTGIKWLKNTSNFVGRGNHSAIWTGTKMIVWGGNNNTGNLINTGGIYDPLTDAWTSISTVNAPSARMDHSAIWTGSKMIVWGGIGYVNGVFTTFANGGMYNPSTDTWYPISTMNSPFPRRAHTAIFTGTKMIIWGGSPDNGASPPINSGGVYDVQTDSWISTSIINAPEGRSQIPSVWTGSKMIIWGGSSNGNALNTGKLFDLQTNSWQDMTTTNAPISRYSNTAVWAKDKMIVWGGFVLGSTGVTNSGGIYDPVTNNWIAMNVQNAPTNRASNSMIWAENKLLIWGGLIKVGNNFVPTNDGGTYDIMTNQWTPIQSGTLGRAYHSSIWTGNQLITFGGQSSSGNLSNGDVLGIKYFSDSIKRMFLYKK